MEYSKMREFARDLATILDDLESLAYYENLAQQYVWLFLRKTASKVISTPNVKNKGAYFNKLVQLNGKRHKWRPSFEKEEYE